MRLLLAPIALVIAAVLFVAWVLTELEDLNDEEEGREGE